MANSGCVGVLVLVFTVCVIYMTYHQDLQGITNRFTRYGCGFPDIAITQDVLKCFRNHHNNIQNSKNFYKQHIDPLPLQRKAVLLLTNYRSGSSFLGQLFNQHPDAFYTFEPLYPVGYEGTKHQKHRILQSCFHCDFLPTIDSYEMILKEQGNAVLYSKVHEECLRQNFCFRSNTEELRSVKVKNSAFIGYDSPVHFPRLNNLCRSRKVSVVKAIRYSNLEELKSVMEDPSLDLKVVHLVRDPRGIINSRLMVGRRRGLLFSDDSTNPLSVSYLCKRMLRNIKTGFANGSDDWIKDKYLRVRYEDLSTKPEDVAKRLYDFVGLSFPTQMKKWLQIHTEGGHFSVKAMGSYSTIRNSKSTMQKWRKKLTLPQVLFIQERCRDTMELLGYTPIETYKELRDIEYKLFT